MRKVLTALVVLAVGTTGIIYGVSYLKQERAKHNAELIAPYQVEIVKSNNIISGLNTRVHTLHERIDKHRGTINDLQYSVDTLKQKNTELEAKEKALQAEKEKLQKELNAVKAAAGKIKPVSVQPKTLAMKSKATLTGFEVTWYRVTGTTASGRQTKDGTTIAVDPRIIPLGTWVELTFPDGRKLIRRADDTGGAVKGRIIDVYSTASRQELLNRGRTHGVTVRILDRE